LISAGAPLGRLQCSPRTRSWNKGVLLLREEEGKVGRDGKRGGTEGIGSEGLEGKGGRRWREKEGKEEGRGRKGGAGETCHNNASLLPAPLPSGVC